MTAMDELRTWVINLDRAPERLQRITTQLERLGIAWTRHPAVDGRTLTPEQRAALDEPAFHRKHGMTPVAGELGCYLSHVEVMREFVGSPASFALILEDDVLLHDSLPAVLKGLVANPDRWDMVKLSAVHSGTPVPVLELAPGYQLAVMLSRCTGSSAYVINRRAARAYLDGLLPMSLPVDQVIDKGWQFGIKVRMVTPTPCTHDDRIATTILGVSATVSRKFHWTKRLPTYAYRVGNELRRGAYAISQLLREKLQ